MKIFLLLTSVLIFCNNVFSQDTPSNVRFNLFGGAAFPQGDFGSTSGQKAGYASTGYSGMLEGSMVLSDEIILVSSVLVAVNSLDASSIEDKISPIRVSAGSYFTTWPMAGIGIETAVSPSVKIYGLAQVGLLISSFPDITLSYQGESITQTTKTATAIGLGIGAGFIINKINLGMRYYSAEPEYEQTASYSGVSNTAKVKLPASVLELLIGFNL
jgi:hypothetical protein